MGSIKCTLRKETKNEIAKYIDNEFINETIKEIVGFVLINCWNLINLYKYGYNI